MRSRVVVTVLEQLATHRLVRSPIDHQQDVLAATVEPFVRAADELELGLDELHQIVEVQYFRQLRRRGLTLKEIAARLGRGERTAKSLSMRARESGLLIASEPMRVARAIVALLGQSGPLPLEDIEAQTDVKPRETVAQVLAQLTRQNVVLRKDRRYELATEFFDLVGSEAAQRLDALGHLMRTVSSAVTKKLLRRSDDGAFVRTLSFGVRRASVAAIREDLYQRIVASALALDAQAEGAPDKVELSLAFVVTEEPSEAPGDGER